MQSQQAFMMLSVMKDMMQMQMNMMTYMPFAQHHYNNNNQNSYANSMMQGMMMGQLFSAQSNLGSMGTYSSGPTIYNMMGAPMQQYQNPITNRPYGYNFSNPYFDGNRASYSNIRSGRDTAATATNSDKDDDSDDDSNELKLNNSVAI